MTASPRWLESLNGRDNSELTLPEIFVISNELADVPADLMRRTGARIVVELAESGMTGFAGIQVLTYALMLALNIDGSEAIRKLGGDA